MNHPVLRFVIKLTVVLTLAFIIHILVLNQLELPLFENKIVLSYVINALLAIGIFLFLFLMKKKYKDQLGFLFLAGSFLKFAVFFIVFYPIYKQDQSITKLEFAAFFVPYVLSLLIETISLSKWLNNLE